MHIKARLCRALALFRPANKSAFTFGPGDRFRVMQQDGSLSLLSYEVESLRVCGGRLLVNGVCPVEGYNVRCSRPITTAVKEAEARQRALHDNPYDTSKPTQNGRYFIADELGVWSQD
jgi:hypothetical protein